MGQTPQTAFPVCGGNVFTQSSVPTCFNNNIQVLGCQADGIPYPDANPYWYKFTCFKGGTLVFSIAPHNLGDDYDWQIFDVTGRDPGVVFTTDQATINSMFVVCNWSGTTGITGTMVGAANLSECATSPTNSAPSNKSKPPMLIKGHDYLLMISHFSGDNQSGYDLAFGGGTASITDTVKPLIQSAQANCAGTKIGVKLNKKMRCSSLAADGSDFTLSPKLATITGVSGNTCTSGFDMDSIILTLSNALPDGKYTLSAETGNDENTLQDICLNQVPPGNSVTFEVSADKPVPFDSLTAVRCAPDTLQLVFSKKIRCTSIAADGSDFTVTGTNAVTVGKVFANCDADGYSNVVYIKLASPIYRAGNYQVTLVTGSDGNTIIDECNLETPAGATLRFSTKDTVSSVFASGVMLGCKHDTIALQHNGNNGVTNWLWTFDDKVMYTTQNVTRIYSDYGTKSVKLVVSNGFCADSTEQSFILDNELKSQFTSPSVLCPEDKAIFVDSSVGKITAWNWYFGNGSTSNTENPVPQQYPVSTRTRYYSIQLVVANNVPCYDTSYKQLQVLYNCYIAVPTAFTPNGDGTNDYLYPLNAYKAKDLEFRVYNRWGQQVFETTDWTRKWDGNINGIPQASGVYAWYLSYTNTDTGLKYFQKGTTVLIR
ncbi:MAG TPA: gliding motility-associated C-terminal domain-containing protein [Chitinophagaceae bacterium]|nr:gliding motility-associated C-terminal domain-containing protein [Chitinophagaceae bacterium]